MRFLMVSLLLFTVGLSDAFSDEPWGKANYKIEAALHDSSHTITAHQTVTYINKAPEELTELHWTLFPNAANGTETHLWRESVRLRMRALLFARESSLGGMDVSNVVLAGRPAELNIDPANPDLAVLPLAAPLAPGDSVTIEMDFSVRVPDQGLMRFERRGSTYSVSQWYPKLAVYDDRGWNPYTYLEMGEFYAEFGDYDVSITLPDNYIVAATGMLVDQAEQERMSSLAAKAEEIYGAGGDKAIKKAAEAYQDSLAEVESQGTRTFRYRANDVIDFAWFASRSFLVRYKDSVMPESGRLVRCEIYVQPEHALLYQDALEWVDSTLVINSRDYGEYPHPKVAVVDQGPSDGGMEYPMITLVGAFPSKSLEESVIVHEVSHNWFFGIVANDQRAWPWLDEALTSYATERYMAKLYPEGRNLFGGKLAEVGFNVDVSAIRTAVLQMANEAGYTAPTTMSASSYPNLITYSAMVYDRGAGALLYLREYVGGEKFDRAMHDYAQRYWMSHPDQDDFKRSLEESTGLDLDWFFSGYLDAGVMPDFDLDLISVKQADNGWRVEFEVEEENNTNLPAQVRLTGGEGQSEEIWLESGEYDQLQQIDLSFKPKQVAVDPDHLTGDRDYRNNFAHRPIAITTPMHLPRAEYRELYVQPYLAYQFSEGLILGGKASNTFFLPGHPEFSLSGGHGFVSGDGNLQASLKNNSLFDGGRMRSYWEVSGKDWAGFRQLKLYTGLKLFPRYRESLQYHRLYAELHLNHIADRAKFDPTLWSGGKHANARFQYRYLSRSAYSRTDFRTRLTQGLSINGGNDEYQKLDFYARFTFQPMRKNLFAIRAYRGEMLDDTVLPLQDRFYASGGVDPNDELGWVPDRTGATWFSQSRNLVRYSGTLLRGYSGMYGDKSATVASVELRRDNWRFFVDSGKFDSVSGDGDWVTSAGITFGNDLFQLHLPLWLSDPMMGSEWVALDNVRNRIYLSMSFSNLYFGFRP